VKHTLDLSHGLVFVPCRIFGPQGQTVVDLALDTGATTTLISWPTALAVGYDPAVAQARVEVTTGSGREYCPRISVARFDALGKSVAGLDILCHDLPAKAQARGLLGLNFLNRFDLRINFKQGFITLR
jgi:predicted aspartyl protease